MGEGSSWLLLGRDDERNIGEILAVDFSEKKGLPDENDLADLMQHGNKIRAKNRIVLPGFRTKQTDDGFWRQNGWEIDDYLPCCGIHSTAAAFGLAFALREKPSSLLLHYNFHASGKQAFVLASTKSL